MPHVAQELIDSLIEAFRNGDSSAADTLWDLAEHMTVEQRADTETKVHKIIDDEG